MKPKLSPPIKSLATFATTFGLALSLLAFSSCSMEESSTGGSDVDGRAGFFIGLKEVPAAEIFKVLPEAQGKATLLDFKSQFCLDCKKIEPVLHDLLPKYPSVQVHVFDIMKDKAKYPEIFNAFKPTTVPVLVFISPKGEIINVMYNYHTEAELTKALNELKEAK